MPVISVRSRTGRALTVLTAAAALAVLPQTAWAARGGSGGSTEGTATPSGGSGGDSIYASVVTYDESKNGSGGSAGPVAPAGDWTPPACWYEPKWSPEEFEKEFRKRWDVPHFSGAGEAYQMSQEHYINGEPYEDFNKDKSGDGMWWEAVRDPAREEALDPAAFACDEATFWVDNGETPEVENAITPDILAQLAYSLPRCPVPRSRSPRRWPPRSTCRPGPGSTRPPSRRSPSPPRSTPHGLNIQATTTAKPVSLKLEPGTKDATTFPASGECAINADGSIGEPYAKGKADEEPSCGLTYLRSSGGKTFPLQATVTWEIAWTGSGGTGGDLPDGTFGAEQAVTVEEIQSVNR